MKKFTVDCEMGTVIHKEIREEHGGMVYTFIGDDIEVKDEYHTMHELYQHRMALTIALFNTWANDDTDFVRVIKSKLHNDGTMFDGGYFIIMASIDGIGQISYHYKLKHWDKFKIPELEMAWEWDGHNSLDVLERLMKI